MYYVQNISKMKIQYWFLNFYICRNVFYLNVVLIVANVVFYLTKTRKFVLKKLENLKKTERKSGHPVF